MRWSAILATRNSSESFYRGRVAELGGHRFQARISLERNDSWVAQDRAARGSSGRRVSTPLAPTISIRAVAHRSNVAPKFRAI